MTEIKSTLDLVLERTKNLNISDEERKTLKRREAAGKIKGLVQKYLDGGLDLSEALSEMKTAVSGIRSSGEILADEILERLDPMDDDRRLCELAEALFAGRAERLRDSIKRWKQAVTKEKRKQAAVALKGWDAKGISGSALIPNVDKDPDWKSRCQSHLAEFRKEAVSILRA